MLRRRSCLIGALLLVAIVATPARATTTTTSTTTASTSTTVPMSPAAFVVVDADTGRVVAARDEHDRRRPGSTIKLVTLLTAERLLPTDAVVAGTALSATMPSAVVGLRPGRTFTFIQVVESMLLASANDAAVALAQRAAGTLDAFALQMQATASQLHLVDTPQLEDPTGLDHTYDHGGGDWISAWDLAIVARRAMTDPVISAAAGTKEVTFADAAGRSHHLVNRNNLLRTYEGTTGLKTGFTHAAGACLIATATRNGRTMLAVVLGSHQYSVDDDTTHLLDAAFATPASAETGPRLDGTAVPTTTTTTPSSTVVAAPRSRTPQPILPAGGSRVVPLLTVLGAAIVIGAAITWSRRRRERATDDA